MVYRSNLAWALYEDGKSSAAQTIYQAVLKEDPDWPKALSERAWQLLTSPEPGQRDGTEALRLAAQACQATGEREPRLLDILAAAYAETGRFAEAVATAEKAGQLAGHAGQPGLAGDIKERLACYEKHEPFRASASLSRTGTPSRHGAKLPFPTGDLDQHVRLQGCVGSEGGSGDEPTEVTPGQGNATPKFVYGIGFHIPLGLTSPYPSVIFAAGLTRPLPGREPRRRARTSAAAQTASPAAAVAAMRRPQVKLAGW